MLEAMAEGCIDSSISLDLADLPAVLAGVKASVSHIVAGRGFFRAAADQVAVMHGCVQAALWQSQVLCGHHCPSPSFAPGPAHASMSHACCAGCPG